MNNSYNLRACNAVNTSSSWSTLNPILLKGELGFESDTLAFKVGDGVTPWNDLPYSPSSKVKLNQGEGVIIQGSSIGTTLLYEEIT